MSGMRPKKKPDGSWLYPRSKDVLEAVGLQTITHYIDVRRQTVANFYRKSANLGTLCRSGEEEGFTDPTVLVGSADGFRFGKREGLAPPCAGPCGPCIC